MIIRPGGSSKPGTLPLPLPPPPPPGSITIPGFTPDYGALIQNDPTFQQLVASLAAGKSSDLSHLGTGISSALVGFGEVPDLDSLGLGGGLYDLDDTTKGLIESSTRSGVSTLAQLQKAYQDRRQRTVDTLASRGILSSGETGYQLGEAGKEYDQSQYTERKQVLDYLSGLARAFAEAESDRSSQHAAGAQSAAAFQAALPQNQPTDPFKADKIFGDQGIGSAWYRGPDGTLYTKNGEQLDVPHWKAELQARMKTLRERGVPWSKIKTMPVWKRWQILKNL